MYIRFNQKGHTMKIGIIGAENSHAAAIAKAINIDKLVKGFSVDYIWGETSEFAANTAKAGQIQNIVDQSKKMLGKIDALIVDHRHPKYHLKAALPFVKQKIPVFVDKPFCFRTAEGEEFLKLAKSTKTPVTSFSVLPEQADFRLLKRNLLKCGTILGASTFGPCDLKSVYGGIFFYGIHQVDLALKAFGYNVRSVRSSVNGNGATGQLFYTDEKIITLNFIKKDCPGFGVNVIGSQEVISQRIKFDKNPYITGIKKFTAMFRTGQMPETEDNMLMPIKILEALEKSSKSGKIEKIK